MVRRPTVAGRCPADAATAQAVVCTGLTKDYGAGHGVFDLELTVHRGETFGFIGPNGAGKTTTIRLLMDLIRADRGTATLFGLDSRRDSVEIKRRVGFLPGELVQFPGVSAAYVIGLLAGLRGGVDPDRITTLADRLDLDLGRRYDQLSHGNKQKVGLIQAFMHRPELVVLDEPTLGLDPLIQREFRELVAESVRDGATVFLSSHVLSEVELICDRIGLIRAGRLDRVGSLNELRQLRIHRVEAVIDGTVDPAALARVPGVSDPTVTDHHVTCAVQGRVAPLLHLLSTADVLELDSHELSLEEVFLGEFDQQPDHADVDRRHVDQPAADQDPAPAPGR
jgi:ABC-2 type transport system ATP-binding protein